MVKHRKDWSLFNVIAPVYGLFFRYQKRYYKKIINTIRPTMDVAAYESVIDLGCGTGALLSVLAEEGLEATGVDNSKNMVKTARKKTKGQGIDFVQGDASEKLPFADKSFDIAISSYVAHGLEASKRKAMISEMCRIARERVVIHDYNDKRSWMVSAVEWLEGGDYFYFRDHAREETKKTVRALESCFSDIEVLDVGRWTNWYVCRPIRQ